MFTSLKQFINSRLGRGIVQEDFFDEHDYYIFIDPSHLYSVLFFLKNDPDLNLTLLDQIIAIPSPLFANNIEPEAEQLKGFANNFPRAIPERTRELSEKIVSQPFPPMSSQPDHLKILYQLKSFKLPYKVTAIIKIESPDQIIPTISPLFSGALWQEQDIAATHHILIEKSVRDQ